MEAIVLRLFYSGSTTASLYVTDLKDATDGGRTDKYKSGPVYIGPGETLDLIYTSDVALSYEIGVIRAYINLGYLTDTFVFGSKFGASLVPAGPAGGQLGGTYPDPDVRGLRSTVGGGTALTIGDISDGQVLARSAGSIIGVSSLPPSGAAGGQLGGTYPNPDVRGVRTTHGGGTELTFGSVADGEVLARSGTDVVGRAVNDIKVGVIPFAAINAGGGALTVTFTSLLTPGGVALTNYSDGDYVVTLQMGENVTGWVDPATTTLTGFQIQVGGLLTKDIHFTTTHE